MANLNEYVQMIETVQSALKSVKLLRSTTCDVFKNLANFPAIGESQNQQGQGDDAKESVFINEFQQSLANINARFRDLESACTLLAPPSAAINLTLGNSSHLGQDPLFERTPLFNEMFNAYRWCDKLHEYAAHAATILQQNLLKRSNAVPFGYNKRNRRLLSHGHSIQPQQVDIFVTNTLQRLYQDMTFDLVRPFGNPLVLKITIPRTLKVVILLRGMLIEWVMIKGFNESFEDENHPYDKRRGFENEEKIDVWSESRYEVFKKITEHANTAMLHFISPNFPDLAFKSFVHWLQSYNSLFSLPCCKCNLRLQNNLPPTWRDLRNLSAYHEQCKP